MSSFVLKWIAVICMLTDHIAYALVPSGTPLYYVLRSVGRLAFPLFAFMIAEGFFYTKNVRRYLMRLALFSIISEIPFDLFLSGTYINWSQQNVFVTLTLALLGLYMFDEFARRDDRLAALLTLFAASAAAFLARSDYTAFGILMVFVFYRYRGERRHLIIWYTLCVTLYVFTSVLSAIPGAQLLRNAYIQTFQLAALPLILMYNRTKGYTGKLWRYFFYAFYPVHLLILYLL